MTGVGSQRHRNKKHKEIIVSKADNELLLRYYFICQSQYCVV